MIVVAEMTVYVKAWADGLNVFDALAAVFLYAQQGAAERNTRFQVSGRGAELECTASFLKRDAPSSVTSLRSISPPRLRHLSTRVRFGGALMQEDVCLLTAAERIQY